MRRIAIAAVALAALAVGACREPSPAAAPPATALQSATATPQPSARAAAEALLRAEKEGDHAASYRLLSSRGRQAFPTAAGWADARRDLPAVTGFAIDLATGTSVVATVDHEPGLDPFVGLSLARERQTWTAVEEAGGWLVDPDPLVEPLLPPEERATDATHAWVRAAQACDDSALASQQGVAVLFGVPDAPDALCGLPGELAAGAPQRLTENAVASALVAQYGAAATEWARAVPVTGGPTPFSVVLAPIGATWRVIGVSQP